MTPELTRRGARVGIVLMTTVLLLITMIGRSAASSASTGQQERNTQVVRDAFARGVGDGASFYSILAEDVQWTVARAVEPKTYTSRAEFLDDGAGPIQRRLDGPIRADVRQVIAEDDVVVAIWDGTATALDGRPYVNSYAWVMTMRDERVVRVTAYLDFVVLDELLARVG